jgi:hypothetical protein
VLASTNRAASLFDEVDPCPSVSDLGAVERAHSSIKLCAASRFEICSTGVEVAQNLATKDEKGGMAKSMQRAASRIQPDPMTRPRPPSPRAMGTAAGVDGAFAVAWAPSDELNTLSRAEVSQATGMLLAQLEVQPAEALVRLRRTPMPPAAAPPPSPSSATSWIADYACRPTDARSSHARQVPLPTGR